MRLFVTVGNSKDSFDRLLAMVDGALAHASDVSGVCQHGVSALRPRNLQPRAVLGRAEFEAELRAADVVVCHAGVGTLASALRAGHQPLVVPRRAAHREIVNDHQLEITTELERSGRIVVVESAADLGAWLGRYARGELARAAPADPAPRPGPIEQAIEALPRRAPVGRVRRAILGTLAAFAPPLDQLRHRPGGRLPDDPV